MPHENELNDLRTDGWFQDPLSDAPTALIPYTPRLPVRPAAEPSTKARQVLLACGAAVVVGVSGVMALIVTADDERPGGITEQLAFPSFAPLTPVSLLPAPATSAAAPAPPVVIAPTTRPVADRTTRPAAPTSAPAVTKPPAAPVQFVAGARIGLEIDGRSGVRLRHRNWVARADAIGSSSNALDKADSSFVVRTGLASDRCFSFESVNYPGYYLRHKNFVLRLERRGARENPQMFNQDASFCPRPTPDGSAVVLESSNFPDRALRLGGDDVFRLEQGTGTAFVVRTALA
ncbi:hypothetical protein GCM10010172_76100 [Paractinoplanes ferrugineus]|uniref:Alpha-L-arabinofuranosidase B arabinose-binding domain-containing protein n=1 Tax=Paractinoplanes ferrugineus TaxID=113564 RepID=A0A919MG46_9ACTN|nr:AbfB domain-containing protein [Actinoplanes ferrugineus]GIE11235.1 hypothetical protein Afe05nite_30750 [Actinoplanes ferrugineus]